MKVSPKALLFLAMVGIVVPVACTTDSRYFGKGIPPSKKRLTIGILAQPESLDPAKTTGGPGDWVIPAFFEGLTQYHPETLDPMAGLATHYESNTAMTQFTFYLRGHPGPKGTKLPDTETLRREYERGKLREDYSRGQPAPTDRMPARWSDGRPITAPDFVYSWRRVADPETAAGYAYLLYCIRNAKLINEGKLKPEELGVRALDDFRVQVDLRASTPFFPQLVSHFVFSAVPRQAIEAARQRGRESSWTGPATMVTSGAFTLKEWRSFDRIIAAKNLNYYEAGLVANEELEFLPIADDTTRINYYKWGGTDLMLFVPSLFVPSLRGKRDFHLQRAFGIRFPTFNTTKPPFNNVLLRYALNMAIDKQAVAGFAGPGHIPALGFVPPLEGYEPPKRLPMIVDGKSFDVLSFDPAGARELLGKAGFPNGVAHDGRRLRVEYLLASLPKLKLEAEILQEQWRRNLNIEVSLVSQEFTVFSQTQARLEYKGVSINVDWGGYQDPNWFLEQFVTGSSQNLTGWSDPRYDELLEQANATIDPTQRMQHLSECEKYLLTAMPILPLHGEVWYFLQKPYVRGVGTNLLNIYPFKYVWIDTNWRPEAVGGQGTGHPNPQPPNPGS
jgi:ABC-type oligopeptide transport system substrate-binding subunit